jgi:CRISPR-associated protein Cmr4
MFEASSLLFIYVETPLHAGSGRGLGAIDLPVQRERVTGYPMVQGSGIKGKLRALTPDSPEKIAVFGPETDEAHKHAGSLSVGDARLLLFPVRSLAGVFAWTTSHDALSRFARDATAAGTKLILKENGKEVEVSLPAAPAKGTVLVTDNDSVTAGGKVVLEEFAYTPAKEAAIKSQITQLAKWLAKNALPTDGEFGPWRDRLQTNLVILPDDAFRDFTQLATEVVTRVKLKDDGSKTVVSGALWTEEALPVDTLLYAPLYATRPRGGGNHSLVNGKDVINHASTSLSNKRLQLGGNETVGRGLVSLRFGSVHGTTVAAQPRAVPTPRATDDESVAQGESGGENDG